MTPMPKPKKKRQRRKVTYDWRTSQAWRDGWNAAIDSMNHHLQDLPVKFTTRVPLSPKKKRTPHH